MPLIRTTIEPTREIDVSDAEFTDHRRRGTLLENTRAKTDEGLIAAALRQTGAVVDAPAPAPAPTPAAKPRRARASRRRGSTAAAATAPATSPDGGAAPPPDAGARADDNPGTTDNAPSGQSEES
jgi:hypothetical protein